MDTPDWLVDLLIVLVVILVIGLIVYFFFPDAWTKIERMADEVFSITKEKEKLEKTEETVKEMTNALTACLDNNFDSCYCSLKRGDLPEGYKISIKNEGSEVVIRTISNQGEFLNEEKIPSMIISMVEIGRYGKFKSDLACKPTNLIITSEENKLWVAETGNAKTKYQFYTDKGLNIPEILKFNNEICFVTDAVEDEVVQFIDKNTATYITEGANIAGTNAQEVDDEAVRQIHWHLDSQRVCSNDKAFDTGTNWEVVWPVDPSNIEAISSCYTLLAGDYGIELDVKDGSEIKSPLSKSVISEVCEAECGEDGPYVVLQKVYNLEMKDPVSENRYGYYAKLSGFDSIGENILKKVEITDKGMVPLGVSQGDMIGIAGSKIKFAYSDEGWSSSTSLVERLLCKLPKLNEEKYDGEKCTKVKELIRNKCQDYNFIDNSEDSLRRLAHLIKSLETEDSGQMNFRLNEDWYLTGFQVNQEDRPKECRDQSCICICDEDDCGNEKTCEIFGYGGYTPEFIQGGSRYKQGTVIEEDDTPFQTVYFERKGNKLGLCPNPPCLVNY